MPASKSMLRLLALGACAEVVTSFGTISDGAVSMTTEGAGATSAGCPCVSSGYWYCKAAGQQSLAKPQAKYTDKALAGFASTCWQLCYMRNEYMENGMDAPLLRNPDGTPNCLTSFEAFQSDMCSPFNIRDTTTESIIDTLKKPTTPSNPFKDSSGVPSRKTSTIYKRDICLGVEGQDLIPPVPAEERCLPITRSRASDPTIYFADGSCQSNAKAIGMDKCGKLYKYYRNKAQQRMAMTCKLEGNKCKTDDVFVATECQALLCGTFWPSGEFRDRGVHEDNAACKITMP